MLMDDAPPSERTDEIPPEKPIQGAARPPATYWLIPLFVALLGSMPWLWLKVVEPPPGMVFMTAAYIPADFLAYHAFIREASQNHSLLLADPFTTDPQSPRFILVFHWLTGLAAAVTRLPPDIMMELARVALVFGFFATWWWFLRPILPDARDRLWAAALAGFSGGFESWVHVVLPGFAHHGADGGKFAADSWMAFGWNFFSSCFNPLWVAGMILVLIVLRAFIAPAAMLNWRGRTGTAAAFFLLFWVHPYSAVGLLAILGMRPVVELLRGAPLEWRKHALVVATLLPALAVIAIIVRWQMQEPIYRIASGGFFGPDSLSVFWYPITLGAVLWFAVAGARQWAREKHPARFEILAWVLAAVLLHTSPLINGFHFVYFLPLPLCIVAAPAVRRLFAPAAGPRWRALAAGGALFAAAPFTTLTAMRTAEHEDYQTVDTMRVIHLLAAQPPGNALVPPPVGNALPSVSGHRVWFGHWFLTPNYTAKIAAYRALASDPRRFPELDTLLTAQRIRYFVVPTAWAPALRQHFGARIEQDIPLPEWTTLILK
jgi:hypothetical protein